MYAYFDVCTHVCNGVDDSAKSYICLLDNYAIFPHYVGYYVNNVYLQIKLKQNYCEKFFSVFIHLTMNAYSSKI